MMVSALKKNKIMILTHPGDKAPIDLKKVTEACEETGTLMEINPWHGHLTVDELMFCSKYEVKKYFKPEFINRIDEIVVFNALNEDMLGKIAHKFMRELTQRLAHKDITLQVSDAVYRAIATQGVDPLYGARPMKRYIQRNIETLIARRMIEGNAGKDDTIRVDVRDGEYTVEITHSEN